MEIDANEVIQKLAQDLGQLHLQLAVARVQVEKLLAEKTMPAGSTGEKKEE